MWLPTRQNRDKAYCKLAKKGKGTTIFETPAGIMIALFCSVRLFWGFCFWINCKRAQEKPALMGLLCIGSLEPMELTPALNCVRLSSETELNRTPSDVLRDKFMFLGNWGRFYFFELAQQPVPRAPNDNFFGKKSVRKTIWDLEFSEHLLQNFLLACLSKDFRTSKNDKISHFQQILP